MASKILIQTLNNKYKITASIIEKFAKIVGDQNPVHLDE